MSPHHHHRPKSWIQRLEATLLQLGCRYLPGMYGVYRRWYQWWARWIPTSDLGQGEVHLQQIVPPLTPFIGRIEPMDCLDVVLPRALVHLEFLHGDRTYRAVVDPARLPRDIARLSPSAWIPVDHGTSRVLPLLQCEYGSQDVLSLVEMYAGPHNDFYADLPWVERSPRFWLGIDVERPLWTDATKELRVLWDDFTEETLCLDQLDVITRPRNAS